MRNIWIIISTLAIANMLALIGFGAWLKATDRLSRDRIERIRTLLTATVEDEERQRAAEQAQREAEQAAAAQAARDRVPPMTADRKLAAAAEAADIAELEDRRIQRDTANLINALMKERQQLERERSEFDARVRAFEAMRARIAEEEGSEQFEKAVTLYKTLKADQARSMMGALIAAGQLDQVVAYLNALPPRIASKIVAEFESDDPTLAANLLERLRTRGTELAALPGS